MQVLQKRFYDYASIYRHQQICNAARLSEGKDHIQKPVRLSKTFNCNICFQTFKRIGHLTVHMKTHSEDNIKYCNTCGKQFKQSDHFKIHVDNCISENIEISESLDIHKEVLLEDFPSFVASSAFPAIDPTNQNSSIAFDTFTPIKSTTIN